LFWKYLTPYLFSQETWDISPSYPNSFKEAIIHTISLGGDTDIIGAMTGAISRAYLWIKATPINGTKLENRGYLEGLAEKLQQIKTQI